MNQILIAAALLACACGRNRTGNDSATAHAAAREARPPAVVQIDSARHFVQRFYDWYLAAEASHGFPYDSLLTSRRAFLSDSLYSALRTDIAFQRADTMGEIASLTAEADVFLNSQDPCARYTAGAAREVANGVAVVVAGNCQGLDARPNIEVHVRRRGASWEIDNVLDPTQPSDDLLSALRRYHAESR